jgi:hypothetical protein
VKLTYNPQKLDDYILNFLSDLDKKLKQNKKSVSSIEKQILQLLISFSLKTSDIEGNCYYFSLPFSQEITWVDFNDPIELDPNIKNLIKRKILDIDKKILQPKKYQWNDLVSANYQAFTFKEVMKLKSLKLISKKTWTIVEKNIYLLYRNDVAPTFKKSQYLFKMYGLLSHREELKEKSQDERLARSNKVLGYHHSLKIFTQNEKDGFRKKTQEHHHLQPSLVKLKGTSLEGILNETLNDSNPEAVVLYEEESHRQGFDLEVIQPNFKRVRISSKTGSFSKKDVVHISSNRTQKHITLKEKTNSINEELKSISIITACVSVSEGSRKKYLRLALNPNKIIFKNDFKNWKVQNKNKRNAKKSWGKYSYDNGKWSALITESKSHQVDFYIPIELFDVVDEFYLD